MEAKEGIQLLLNEKCSCERKAEHAAHQKKAGAWSPFKPRPAPSSKALSARNAAAVHHRLRQVQTAATELGWVGGQPSHSLASLTVVTWYINISITSFFLLAMLS
jgi:hypothetical protein